MIFYFPSAQLDKETKDQTIIREYYVAGRTDSSLNDWLKDYDSISDKGSKYISSST